MKSKVLYNIFIRRCSDRINTVPYSIVFFCRTDIEPMLWCWGVNDKRLPYDPVPKKYYKLKYDKFDALKMSGKETVGHILLLEKIKAAGTLDAFCEMNGVPKDFITNAIYKRTRVSGVESFKCLPSIRFMTLLRNVVHPDCWCLYPEELNVPVEKLDLIYLRKR